jgi:hypothetical protein
MRAGGAADHRGAKAQARRLMKNPIVPVMVVPLALITAIWLCNRPEPMPQMPAS